MATKPKAPIKNKAGFKLNPPNGTRTAGAKKKKKK